MDGLMVVVLAEVAEIVLTDFSLSHETSIYSETSCVQNQSSSKITFSNCVHRLRHVINYILVCVDMIHGWFSKLHYWIVTALDVIKWLVLLKAGSKLHPFHCTGLRLHKLHCIACGQVGCGFT